MHLEYAVFCRSPYILQKLWSDPGLGPGIIPAVNSADALSDDEAAQLLRRSYDLVFARLTRKLQREIAPD
jgi:hypothetical protein